MEKICIYRAFDGKEFKFEEDCVKYEEEHNFLSSTGDCAFYNDKGNLVKRVDVKTVSCVYFARFDCEESIRQFNMICKSADEQSIIEFEQYPSTQLVWMYSYEAHKWIPVELLVLSMDRLRLSLKELCASTTPPIESISNLAGLPDSFLHYLVQNIPLGKEEKIADPLH